MLHDSFVDVFLIPICIFCHPLTSAASTCRACQTFFLAWRYTCRKNNSPHFLCWLMALAVKTLANWSCCQCWEWVCLLFWIKLSRSPTEDSILYLIHLFRDQTQASLQVEEELAQIWNLSQLLARLSFLPSLGIFTLSYHQRIAKLNSRPKEYCFSQTYSFHLLRLDPQHLNSASLDSRHHLSCSKEQKVFHLLKSSLLTIGDGGGTFCPTTTLLLSSQQPFRDRSFAASCSSRSSQCKRPLSSYIEILG